MKPCPIATQAATTAARVILERLPELARHDPRSERLRLAVLAVLDAGAELQAADNAEPGRLENQARQAWSTGVK